MMPRALTYTPRPSQMLAFDLCSWKNLDDVFLFSPKGQTFPLHVSPSQTSSGPEQAWTNNPVLTECNTPLPKYRPFSLSCSVIWVTEGQDHSVKGFIFSCSDFSGFSESFDNDMGFRWWKHQFLFVARWKSVILFNYLPTQMFPKWGTSPHLCLWRVLEPVLLMTGADLAGFCRL